jgi:SAM-dependent methyltransferase
MANEQSELLAEVNRYYSGKIRAHGANHHGVDWNSKQGQELRFEQLCKILPRTEPYTINDLGCGYGALLDYLEARHAPSRYIGIDVSEEMVAAAEQRHRCRANARFIQSHEADEVADYSMASGIFNVRLQQESELWLNYIKATLDVLNHAGRAGFAFNCLTSYSDKDKQQDRLFYADPCQLFDLCKRRYSRNVALLHDYGLYEFTILVRKMT